MKVIFLVEDDEGIREMVAMVLEMANYQVFSFSNIWSAQVLLETKVPDLLLLDVMLPDGNGISFCEQIKELEKTRDTPVILMSAHADLKRANKADDFIAKPFDIDEILSKIQAAI